MKGLIVKIDGLDGCGKSDLISRIEQQLGSRFSVVSTLEFGTSHDVGYGREAEGQSVSAFLRRIALDGSIDFDEAERQCLFALMSRRHNRIVLPLLRDRHDLILVDRSSLSNQAIGAVKNPTLGGLFECILVEDCADLIMFLDTPPATCAARVRSRALDAVESENLRVAEQSRSEFLRLIQEADNAERLDGTLPLETLTTIVANRIVTLLSDR